MSGNKKAWEFIGPPCPERLAWSVQKYKKKSRFLRLADINSFFIEESYGKVFNLQIKSEEKIFKMRYGAPVICDNSLNDNPQSGSLLHARA